MNQQLIEIRDRLAQGDFKRMVVDRFYAKIGGRFFTGDDVVDIRNVAVLQVAFIRRGGFRVSQALPAVNEILCRDRLAIGPFCVFTQMEGPDFKIFVFPLFGNTRARVAFNISNQQTFEEVAVDVGLRHAFNFMRVERLHFRTVVAHQRLFLRQLHTRRNIRGHCVTRD